MSVPRLVGEVRVSPRSHSPARTQGQAVEPDPGAVARLRERRRQRVPPAATGQDGGGAVAGLRARRRRSAPDPPPVPASTDIARIRARRRSISEET